jgi:octaprenyl-diphosphate synthase
MDLKDVIRYEADRIDAEMRRDLAETPGVAPLLAEILEYGLFSGGKRVRPLLTVLCSRLCGRDDEQLYRLAAAFEYLHAATLFHDDVIDHADTRRGRMSVVKRYGRDGAILAGDFLHAQAMAMVGHYGGVDALAVFVEATRGMVSGEFLQMDQCCRADLSEDDYYSIIRGKTALLIGAACQVGVMYADGDDRYRSALRAYGLNLGAAFQVIDDLLDYQGDSRHTGKAVGNDLVEGKVTLPLILALQQAGETERAEIVALLQDEERRGGSFAMVDHFIAHHHGYQLARQRAEQLAAEAITALDPFRRSGNEQSLHILEQLVQYVLGRRK